MERYRFPKIAPSIAAASRQAIYGSDGAMLGYELLWRRTPTDKIAEVTDDSDATLQALFAVALNVGWQAFFEGLLAFVNVGLEFFERHLYAALPPKDCVLEVQPFEDYSAYQRNELFNARRLGYLIAWDAVHSCTDPRLALARAGDYIKIDIAAAERTEVAALIDFCTEKKLVPIAYKIESEASRLAMLKQGAAALQGRALGETEILAKVRLPAPPVEFLHAFRCILITGGPMTERVRVVEDCPELLLALLMLTDVAWQPHWPSPNSVEQLLRGFSRASVVVWLDIMLYQLYRETPARRLATALLMLKPAIFARLACRKMCPSEKSLHDESFFGGFVAHLRCTHPHLIDGTRAPIHVGQTLQRNLSGEHSPLRTVFDYVWAVSRGEALGKAPNIPKALHALVAASSIAALGILSASPKNTAPQDNTSTLGLMTDDAATALCRSK